MQTVAKTLHITASNVDSLCTAHTLRLNETVSGHGKKAFRLYLNGAKSGYGELNSSAKEHLFPTVAAKPYMADITLANAVRQYGSTSDKNQGWITFNGGEYCRTNLTTDDTDYPVTGITDAHITSATRASTIQVHFRSSGTTIVNAGDAIFTLYFNEYTCSANVAGNGVTAASVDKVEAYDGESVTFTATLKTGATWHGWYSDAACTQLVSTEQTYAAAAADLTLYAKATIDGTGMYVKTGGAYAQAQTAYKKVSGAWVKADTAALKTELQSGNYTVRSE
jgi:hypothetical protein